MERKLLLYALPFFALSMMIDFMIDYFKKTNRYKIPDSITSLNIGFLGTTFGILTTGVSSFFYSFFYEKFHLFEVKPTVLNYFIAAFVFDFFFYWNHRAHHRINLFWAFHSTHHNSQYFNFTTALRQSSLTFLTFWPFFIPMAIFGFNVEFYFFGSAISVIYGFFTHIEGIKKIPYFEYIFVGPMSHSIHHAVNDNYIDKNYGSILNIWDRMFNTYKEDSETEPVIYGTVTQFNSFNPFYANSVFYQFLLNSFLKTKIVSDKFLLWFKETGYSPKDCSSPKKSSPSYLSFKRLDVHLNSYELVYSIFLFLLSTISTIIIVAISKNHSFIFNSIFVVLTWLGILSVAFFFEQKLWRYKFEFLRNVISLSIVILYLLKNNDTHIIYFSYLGLFTVSLISLIPLKKLNFSN